MADVKTNEIFTRVQLKYDSYVHWDAVKNTFKPLPGEVCIVEVPTGNAAATTAPTVLFKVGAYKKDASGNNTTELHTFAELPWASALAADVHAWAKKTEAEFIAWAKGLVPVEVIDSGTGKFVTGVTATNDENGHHITITRANVEWSDIQSKPNLVNSVKVTDDDVVIGTPVDATSGDVTIDIKHKAYNKAGSTSDASSDATTAGASVTIKVPTLTVDAYGHTEFNGETSHTITIPSEVAVGDGNITIAAGDGLAEGGSFNVNQDSDATITLKHGDTSSVEDVVAADRTYVKSLTFDEFGHVTAVDVGTETVKDTNTAHTHVNGKGIVVDNAGGITGSEVRADLNIKFKNELVNNMLQLVDATDETKLIAQFNASNFIKDGFLSSVTKDTDTNEIIFNWNTDAGITETRIDIDELVEVYTGGDLINIENWVIDHAVPAGATAGKTMEGAQTPDHGDTFNIPVVETDAFGHVIGKTTTTVKLPELDLSGYKTKQEVLGSQDFTGSDVICGVSQDENGVIATHIRQLTPGDIGAQPEGNYKVVQDEKNYTGSTVKTVTEVKQDTNGVITEVKFEDIAFPALPSASGSAIIATIADGFVVLKGGVALSEDEDGNHELANDASADIELAKIAATGNIADLIQDAGTYVVFNCGTASTVI